MSAKANGREWAEDFPGKTESDLIAWMKLEDITGSDAQEMLAGFREVKRGRKDSLDPTKLDACLKQADAMASRMDSIEASRKDASHEYNGLMIEERGNKFEVWDPEQMKKVGSFNSLAAAKAAIDKYKARN